MFGIPIHPDTMQVYILHKHKVPAMVPNCLYGTKDMLWKLPTTGEDNQRGNNVRKIMRAQAAIILLDICYIPRLFV